MRGTGGRGLLLRRRRLEPGHVPRGDEPGRDLEAAGRLRLREQPVRRGDPVSYQCYGRATSPTVRRATASPAWSSTARTCSRSTRRPREAIERARRGDGPSLIEAKTYRFHGHDEGDAATYRTAEEVETYRATRPASTTFEAYLHRQRMSRRRPTSSGSTAAAQTTVDAALRGRREPAPWPEAAADDPTEDVYVRYERR